MTSILVIILLLNGKICEEVTIRPCLAVLLLLRHCGGRDSAVQLDHTHDARRIQPRLRQLPHNSTCTAGGLQVGAHSFGKAILGSRVHSVPSLGASLG